MHPKPEPKTIGSTVRNLWWKHSNTRARSQPEQRDIRDGEAKELEHWMFEEKIARGRNDRLFHTKTKRGSQTWAKRERRSFPLHQDSVAIACKGHTIRRQEERIGATTDIPFQFERSLFDPYLYAIGRDKRLARPIGRTKRNAILGKWSLFGPCRGLQEGKGPERVLYTLTVSARWTTAQRAP